MITIKFYKQKFTINKSNIIIVIAGTCRIKEANHW